MTYVRPRRPTPPGPTASPATTRSGRQSTSSDPSASPTRPRPSRASARRRRTPPARPRTWRAPWSGPSSSSWYVLHRAPPPPPARRAVLRRPPPAVHPPRAADGARGGRGTAQARRRARAVGGGVRPRLPRGVPRGAPGGARPRRRDGGGGGGGVLSAVPRRRRPCGAAGRGGPGRGAGTDRRGRRRRCRGCPGAVPLAGAAKREVVRVGGRALLSGVGGEAVGGCAAVRRPGREDGEIVGAMAAECDVIEAGLFRLS